MNNKLTLIFVAILTVFVITSCTKPIESNLKDDNYQTASEEIENTDTIIPTQDVAATKQHEEVIIKSLSFLGCGDNIIYGTKGARANAVEGGRALNYKPYYDGVSQMIYDADISFINQETLMCGDGYSYSYYPMFNSPQEVGLDLVDLGFDIVNISNNHMFDKGADGLSKTIDFWKNQDVLMIGGYENPEDFDNIRIFEKDGLKIAFLSYTYATNGLSKPSSSSLAIPYINDEDITRQTSLAKEKADLVFVSVHWGDEGSFVPNQEQKRVAQLFADCGIDAIIGHHPHVIQPVEWIYGENGNKTLCVYSLGNFMAQQDRDYNMIGGMISFDIVYSSEDDPMLENVQFIPTVFHFGGNFLGNNVMPFSEYSPELANIHGVRTYYGNKMDYETLLGYIKNTISGEFLPEFYHESAQ